MQCAIWKVARNLSYEINAVNQKYLPLVTEWKYKVTVNGNTKVKYKYGT